MATDEHAAPAPWLAGMRLGVGLAQGLALYLLYSAFDAKTWPATDGQIFAPLVLMSLFVPLIVIQGAGNLRTATLIIWTVAAAGIIAALGWYDIWRAWPVDYVWQNGKLGPEPHVLPTVALCFFMAVGLFIAHALISGGDADRKFFASYPTHFDIAWKLGVQVALAIAFTCAFWLILWLGAGLFNLINLDFFEKLIEHRWFAIPATALATAASLHVSDVRAVLVRGIRTLALVLLSWLLPLMALIAGAFLASLVFTGLAPLWATRHATALLLTAAAVLVILINTAYQDGHAERTATSFFGLAIRLASLLLVPTVGLAAYALWLRVDQYGWTVGRIASAACALVAASYALGYAASAVLPSTRLIERWNFATALGIVVTLLVLFTPVADPARISVASQVVRLQAGKVKPEAFDFGYLRWQGERYGRDALQRLASAPNASAIRRSAKAALEGTSLENSVPAEPLSARITVHPAGKSLPAGFLATKWGSFTAQWALPDCLRSVASKCDATLVDIDGDGHDEVLVLDYLNTVVFTEGPAGHWRIAGVLDQRLLCGDTIEKVKQGKFTLALPDARDKGIAVGSRVLRLSAIGADDTTYCGR
jgi:hypothetical protein